MFSRLVLTLLLILTTVAVFSADLPSPKTGGPGGKPVTLLVLTNDGQFDAQYEKELTDAGYRITKTSYGNRLSPAYLAQFGAIILARLPYAGEKYQVGGEKLAYLDDNLAMVRDYLTAGGGVLFETAMSEFGEAYADTYNRFLQPYDAQIIPQQLRDDAETKGAYAAGVITGKHPIVEGLKNILYPINVLRWDHAYATTPVVTGPTWTVLASGKPTSGTHQAIDNAVVGEQLTTNRNLFAIRQVGKGYLAVSAIHSYYLLTNAYAKSSNLGENNTGVIDGIVLKGEQAGRPSDGGKLLDRTYRFLAANSTKNSVGAGDVELPAQPQAPTTTAVIDWHTATPPPTWQHRVIPIWLADGAYYDEVADPSVQGDLQYYKALIGPRTAYSGAKGTVKEYRDAAMKAGYSAVIFCEPLAKISKVNWEKLVAECDANTDNTFACLPGFDLEDFQGGHYLVLGARRYPDPSWLTEDGKKLQAVRMLSLGWFGHVTSIHRSGRSVLHPKMYKHFQGVTVYTYNTKGQLVDDALNTYQWQVGSDSNPIPITAHEVESPDDVAVAAKSGFQQMMPAPSLTKAVEYFRFGLPHYFEDPLRYFISEGPVLNGWSMLNKDLGNPAENRDHFRLGIGITGADPIAEVDLYDGFDVAGRWYPNDKAFSSLVDGNHEAQHEYMVLARDSAGHRVLSPGIRTTTRNWRLRCGDRQNWLGSMFIYTGWRIPDIGNYSIAFKNTREGGTNWLGDGGGNPCPIFDFPFFSNHVQMTDVDLTTQYVDTDWEKIGGDAKPTYAVRPSDFTDGHLRTEYFVPKPAFAVTQVDFDLRLKREVEPDLTSPLYPVIASAMGQNDLVILPGKAPIKFAEVKEPLDLPVGSYVGGIVTLTPGLQLSGKSIGFPAPPADTLTLPEGTSYAAKYLVLKSSNFSWRSLQSGYDVDAQAVEALTEMGFNGQPPYTFTLTQGKMDKIAYDADCTAQNGGIAGTLTNAAGKALLYDIPLRINNLNPRYATAVWRADAKKLDYFACYQNQGMVTFNADKTVDFYAGNVVTTDPALFVSTVIWNDQEAWFRVNNPTKRDITTDFATVSAIKGFKPVKKTITIKAGQSLDVKE